MPSCGVCPSVRHVCELSKQIKLYLYFFTVGYSHTILVFSYQTLWQYFDGDPLTGASNAGEKIAIFDQYLPSSRVVNAATARCYQHVKSVSTLLFYLRFFVSSFLPRDAMHKRGLCRHARCLSCVGVSVTFVDHVKTN